MELRSVRTSSLDIAYLAGGPADGPPVLLLHGFPDDATSWNAVGQRLAEAGRRVVAPYVRGCGPTRFLDPGTPRAGDFAALGSDALALVDALQLSDFVVVGQDWGSPTAEIVAMERASRVRRLGKLNWYGVYSMAEMARATGFRYAQLRTLWYVWLLNAAMGPMVLQHDRDGFAAALWAEWSPSWDAQRRAAALAGVLPSFQSEDWVRVALSAYRANLSQSEMDPAHAPLRERLAAPSRTACDTFILTGQDDGVERSLLDAAALQRWFERPVRTITLPGIGHFPQREAAGAVAEAILA